MSRPTTQHPHGHHRFNIMSWFKRQPFGLPMFEVIWGSLFLVGMLAALALAIWSAIADGPIAK